LEKCNDLIGGSLKKRNGMDLSAYGAIFKVQRRKYGEHIL
jgi:hypothetical protein